MARRKKTGGGTSAPNSWKDAEFSQEELEYSQEEWLIPARDGQGFSSRTFFRLSPTMERAMSIVIQHKVFPYKTVSDLIRHGLYRHLGFLFKLEPTIRKHHMGALEAIAELVRDDIHRSDMEEVFNGLGRRIEHHIDKGDMGEVYRLAALVKSQIKVLEESAWKTRYMEKFNRQFKGLGSGGARGGLVQMPKRLTAGDAEYGDDDDS